MFDLNLRQNRFKNDFTVGKYNKSLNKQTIIKFKVQQLFEIVPN